MGRIRGVLWQHLHAHAGGIPEPPEGDPNALLPCEPFAAALEEAALHGGDAALREAGASYVALWARTFRTLVRHLRGHPAHALQLWTTEVYPYLRGDRLAARAERTGRHAFDVLVQDDLPAAYVAGMLEAFVALSQADAEVRPVGGGRYRLTYKVRPTERVARLAYVSSQLRIPLLLTALLAALVGTAMAFVSEGTLPWQDVLAVLWGTVAAQSGANAFHDLYTLRRQPPLAAPGPSRNWLRFQWIGSYVVAAAAMLWIVPRHPGIVVYAAIGLGLGLLYRRLRDEGWGPLIAAVSHGPLTVWGGFHALAGPGLLATPVPALLLALPTGLLAAAVLYLDDLADRPLDEAAGKRTLVVRIPRRRHAVAFAALLFGALVSLAAMVGPLDPLLLVPVALLVVVAAVLVLRVRRHLDDPHGLAPSRVATLLLYVAAAATLVASILTGATA